MGEAGGLHQPLVGFMMERKIIYKITAADAGQSVGDYLKARGYSHACIVHLKKTERGIRRNGAWAYVREILQENDCLEIFFAEEEASWNITASDLPLEIVYEDEDILIVNKGADMPVHPSQGNYENSLANAVMNYYGRQGKAFVFRCVNRLDRDTSGLVLIAKNMLSAAVLNQAMIRREIHRTYLAVVKGAPRQSGTIDLPIARREGSTIERCIDFERGERAVTHYEVLKRNERYTLLKIWLETGRTHQIRVHMNAAGFPLPGDFLYAPDFTDIGRQALHSWKLEFVQPVTGKAMRFEQPLPEDMRKLL